MAPKAFDRLGALTEALNGDDPFAAYLTPTPRPAGEPPEAPTTATQTAAVAPVETPSAPTRAKPSRPAGGPRRRGRTASRGPSGEESATVQITVALPQELHDRLHHRAIAAGSPKLKSAVLRDALDRFLDELDELAPDATAFGVRLERIFEWEARQRGARRASSFRFTPDQRGRLLDLTGRTRLPMNHAILAAAAHDLAEERWD